MCRQDIWSMKSHTRQSREGRSLFPLFIDILELVNKTVGELEECVVSIVIALTRLACSCRLFRAITGQLPLKLTAVWQQTAWQGNGPSPAPQKASFLWKRYCCVTSAPRRKHQTAIAMKIFFLALEMAAAEMTRLFHVCRTARLWLMFSGLSVTTDSYRDPFHTGWGRGE